VSIDVDGHVVTEEIVDQNQIMMLKPMKRYGRICDCPKDPKFSMFCIKARNWYEMTSSGSQSLSNDTKNKYSKMKEIYKNLTTI